MSDIAQNYLEDALKSFRAYKKLGEKALAQVSDGEFFRLIDEESNSLAVIVKHIAGNLRSRWTEFLTTDGEKPDRNRDGEFEVLPSAQDDEIVLQNMRAELMNFWERGWQTLFDTLESLKVEDLVRTVTIRGEVHTVVEAINRQLTHYAYHVGQIAFLAKHFRSRKWQTLSVPRNRSAEFNAYLSAQTAQQTTSTERAHHLDTPEIFNRQEKDQTR